MILVFIKYVGTIIAILYIYLIIINNYYKIFFLQKKKIIQRSSYISEYIVSFYIQIFVFQILHFFNAPTDVCGIAVHRAVSDALCRTDAIRSITIRMHYCRVSKVLHHSFTVFLNLSFSVPKKPKAKCSTGLIELKSMALAARTVLLSNHMTIESTGEYVLQ